MANYYVVIVELVVDHAPAAGATAGVDAAMTRVRAEAACGLRMQRAQDCGEETAPSLAPPARGQNLMTSDGAEDPNDVNCNRSLDDKLPDTRVHQLQCRPAIGHVCLCVLVLEYSGLVDVSSFFG